MRHFAVVFVMASPLVLTQLQVTAGYVLVPLLGSPGGLHSLGSFVPVHRPADLDEAWVEFLHQAHQGARFLGLELFTGRRVDVYRRGDRLLTWKRAGSPVMYLYGILKA